MIEETLIALLLDTVEVGKFISVISLSPGLIFESLIMFSPLYKFLSTVCKRLRPGNECIVPKF